MTATGRAITTQIKRLMADAGIETGSVTTKVLDDTYLTEVIAARRDGTAVSAMASVLMRSGYEGSVYARPDFDMVWVRTNK